jgi:hypothetical protein
MMRINCRGLATLLAFCCLAATATHAQQPAVPPPGPPPPGPTPPAHQTPEHPAIEPAAVEMLKAASARLADAKSMSFTAITTYEALARTEQPLYYTTLSEVAERRPDKLRVVTPGDGPPSNVYYDGKSLMVYAPAADLTAVDAAPPTIDAMLNVAFEKDAIFFPFAAVIVADPYHYMSEGLVSAFVVGQSHVVGDTITDMVAITNGNVQAEIWIGVNDGLPRMIRAVYPRDPMHARYEVQFTNWRLNPVLRDADFTSAQAAKAPRMQFARPDAPTPAKP